MQSDPIISISHLTPELQNVYLIAALARIWRRKGFKLKVGLTYEEGAALCILHHDLARIKSAPEPPRNTPHLNGHVRDISQRLVSQLTVQEGDDWCGPIIIGKTNANHFGLPESLRTRRSLITRANEVRKASWRAARMLPERNYPILQSIAEVPGWVWRDPEILVEKYLPERSEDGLYCVRNWVFFGEESYGYRALSSLIRSSRLAL